MSCISVQNLSLSFGEKTLFDNVSFDVYEKDKIGFVGANGVGKTSLFKILTGEYQPTSGAAFLGKNVKLGYMEQHTCSENKTVYEELISVFDDLIKLEKELDDIASRLTAEPLPELIAKQDMLNEQFTGNGGLTYKSLTRSCLIGMGFSESDFDKPTSKLSGGQRSKLILSKLLLSKSDYIKNLDSSKREQIKSQIRIADMRLGHINSTKGFLYEEYRAGKYTKDRFKEIQQTNQMECERLQIQIKDLRKELEDWNKRYDAACNTTQSVKDILALSEYRPEVIARLVDQVRVFENGRVEIEFRNVDAFERLLLPESISHPMKHNAV